MTKVISFKTNYEQDLRIGFELRKKEKSVRAEEFVQEMKKTQEKIKATLRKAFEVLDRIVEDREVNKSNLLGLIRLR